MTAGWHLGAQVNANGRTVAHRHYVINVHAKPLINEPSVRYCESMLRYDSMNVLKQGIARYNMIPGGHVSTDSGADTYSKATHNIYNDNISKISRST